MSRFLKFRNILTIIDSLFLLSRLGFGSVGVVQAADSIEFAIITDYGYASDTTVADVADMVNSWNPDFIVTAGDNNQDGDCDQDCYASVVGAYYGPEAISSERTDFMSSGNFYPLAGNHDYYADSSSDGLDNYLAYFTLPAAGEAEPSYYDFVQGPVHFFMLDSGYTDNAAPPSSSTQQSWLQAGLSASTATWNIVMFHIPAYSSGTSHVDNTYMQWDFEGWGADFVITGHVHVYDRIYKGEGNLRYFTAGTAGNNTRNGNSSYSGVEAYYYNGDSGAMRVNASDTSITFEYITTNGTTDTVRDKYLQAIGENDWHIIYFPIIMTGE
jgi:tartrate-resistant acid phosphatase type 5